MKSDAKAANKGYKEELKKPTNGEHLNPEEKRPSQRSNQLSTGKLLPRKRAAATLPRDTTPMKASKKETAPSKANQPRKEAVSFASTSK